MRYLLFLLLATYTIADEFPSLVRTHHTAKTEKGSLSYSAVTGKFPVKGEVKKEEEETPSEIFFIAYLAEEEEESHRPITFMFPGGPGGSSAVEAICTFGPRRLSTPAEGKTLLPPYKFIDNPESLLPWTDIVFVDPVGTGFSTLGDNEEDAAELFSVEGDIAALGDFIRHFVAYFNRWSSPKYLGGISYGTARCAGLAEYLLRHDFSIHGLIVLGTAIDYSTLVGQHNRPLPDALLIPTFAATAWYHKRLWPEKPIEEVVEYARRFAFEEYVPALLQPSRLSKPEQDALYQKMATLIGLPFATVERYQGRFDEDLYTTEFFASERKILGGLDTRYKGDLGSSRRYRGHGDPSYRDMQGVFCAFHDYLQNELETENPFKRYVSFSALAFFYWDFRTYDSGDWPDLIQRIRRTLIYNPQMKVFVGSGYYDCRTPFAATEYSFDHLNLPDSYRPNFQFKYYEAGHGFIFDHPSLKKLKRDLVAFYEKE